MPVPHGRHLLPSWRSCRIQFVCLGILTLTFLSASGLQPPPSQDPISAEIISGDDTFAIQLENKEGAHSVFKVVGWDHIGLVKSEAANWGVDRWQALFSLYVNSGSPSEESLPPLLGSYRIEQDDLIFQPRFPLEPGLRYRAVFNPRMQPNVAQSSDGSRYISVTFAIPKAEAIASTTVENVYPSTDRLPENQLKFYLHFSAPMSRGEAYHRIHLLDESGEPVDLPFLELDEELWDREGKRLTLLFDPGRIKQGLVPHEEVGAAIKEGHNYRLVIDRDWLDAERSPLKEGFEKSFGVVAADRESPDPKTWRLTSPRGGTLQPLSIEFPEPMERALLLRLLDVMDPAENFLDGSVQVDREETRWQFTPREPWSVGDYSLSIGTTLEDLAGNRIGRLFEVDVFERVEERITTTTVSLPFKVLP